ncbi:MAG: anti-sigma factor, partial [Chloroflexota bacterium]|nr:anti-sigma factor [Chloroflexota bacterium]
PRPVAPAPRPVAPAPEVPDRAAAPFARPTAAPARTRPGRLPALVGLAAALIVAVAGTGVVVNATRDADVRAQADQVEALGTVARWTVRVDGRPDVRRIALTSTSGAPTTASLIFSPSTTELVVVADQLAPPPAGREYRCWLEVDGTRASIGKMYFGGDLAYWVGDVAELAGLGPGARFGVSLVELSGSTPGEPVLVGSG